MNLSVRLKTNEIELPLEQPTHVYFPEQAYFPLDPTTLTVHSSPPAGHSSFLDQPHLRASNASLQGSSGHHQQLQQQNQSGQGGGIASGSGANGSGNEGNGRAVDNQYSFT